MGSIEIGSTWRQACGGFTLIEVLVVVLILALLMAVALPLYLSAVNDAERRVCRVNMKTISGAAQATRVKNLLGNYGSIISNGVGALADLTGTPICPAGGTYSLENGNSGNSSTFRVRCSLASHGTFQLGLDSS